MKQDFMQEVEKLEQRVLINLSNDDLLEIEAKDVRWVIRKTIQLLLSDKELKEKRSRMGNTGRRGF